MVELNRYQLSILKNALVSESLKCSKRYEVIKNKHNSINLMTKEANDYKQEREILLKQIKTLNELWGLFGF